MECRLSSLRKGRLAKKKPANHALERTRDSAGFTQTRCIIQVAGWPLSANVRRLQQVSPTCFGGTSRLLEVARVEVG